MPRIMTMNGDHQSVATAPLDLSTTNRERGSAGSRTPDCGLQRSRQVCSPAPSVCTGTNSPVMRCPTVRTAPGSATGASRKRPADSSSLRLPLRKRPFPVELETQTQSPAPPESGDRLSPVKDFTITESFAGGFDRIAGENRVGVAPVTPRWILRTGQSPDTCPIGCLHPFNYGQYPVYYLTPVLEPRQALAHQINYLLPDIALATHQDEDGDTALHIAVVKKELTIVYRLIHLLLLAHKGLDIYNNLRQTPLHLAVITHQADMVDTLLKAGADPAALDRNGQTALHLCCEYNQRECLSVVLALSLPSKCLDSKNYEGLSPLHLAVLRGLKDLARMLLDAGADINVMDIKSGHSPLMHAVEGNNTDMVHFLIENGCDVNGQSYSGNTALHSACGRGQVDTVRLLLKSGADSSLKNYHNDTPVMVAKNKKIADVLRGRASKHIRAQDQHSVSISPHGSNLTENGSPSPSHSRGCSPSATPHTPHHSTAHSPKTPSVPVHQYY
ncbi:B-cell lymphoma 3 protein homolog [Toxotes jaculatrix]|uniref:B-cell lymphoma 3 protein homolog n=1 Tax=Toxotes jaculatrix TaxID=941984 RepID=UPI001B3AB3A1|nr:B-cell lymphoma 3 protein homolog [Toxotes jaculatrix]